MPFISNAQTITQLRHNHYYEGKPITEFRTIPVKVDLKKGSFSFKAPAVFDRSAYCGTDSGKVYSVGLLNEGDFNGEVESLADKTPKTYSVTGSILNAPFVTENLVIAGSTSGFLTVFDRHSQAVTWKFKAKAPITTAPLFALGMVYFASDDGKFYALDSIGKIKWKFDLKDKPASPAYDDSVIYLATTKSLIVALDAKTGKELWRSTAGGRTPCVGERFVYIINQNGALIALDKKDGIDHWRYDDGENISSSALEITLSRNTIIYSAEKKIIVMDPLTGVKQWEKEFEQRICGDPMIVTDVVYVPCSDFHLYGVDLASGVKLAQADIGFAPYGSPAYADGKIFYPSKKVLYILSGKE
ncbi:MAG TPA: PQQ-binding-like beta-propeller repeat protein [Candidatus Kapabacteria bacterium]|nr:PQQ-binding-like beta-propeller repeat protein [Candidatus Kapabacteria bacterium]